MTISQKWIFAILFTFSFFHSGAQENDRNYIINTMPQIGIPVGDIAKTNGVILGGHAQYEGETGSQTRFLVQLGGGLMQGKKYETELGYEDSYPAVTLAQLRAGMKYFVPGTGLFVAGLVGGAQSFSRGTNAFGLSYAPVIGFDFGNGVQKFDFSIRYDESKFKEYNISTVSFSIGYHL